MLACYIDEAGDTGQLPSPTSPVQPLLCILGLTLDIGRLRDFTVAFIDLKTRFFPGLFQGVPRLERILTEVKGAEIRRAFRAGPGKHVQRHHHVGFLDELLSLVEGFNCKVLGRVWVKAIGEEIDRWGIYTSSIQAIYSTFQDLLTQRNDVGIVIADSRTKVEDRRVSFSILTQKFKFGGDKYFRIVEMPTFGQSDNHAGIQVCDLLCSGLLFPIAAYAFCMGYVTNIHVDPGYAYLRKRYGLRLRALQHRYQLVSSGKWSGGIIVSDPLGQRSGGHLFR